MTQKGTTQPRDGSSIFDVARRNRGSPTRYRLQESGQVLRPSAGLVGLSGDLLHHAEPPGDRDRKCPKEVAKRGPPGTGRS